MSAEKVQQVAQLVITDAVRTELHYAVEKVCDDLLEQGQLGETVTFTLTPADGERGKGDELAVTLTVQFCPMFDGQPCGYFVPVPAGNEGVVKH